MEGIRNEEMKKVTLPGNREIYCINEGEVEFLYDEIFQKEMYFKHGISLPSDNPFVIDIGANIGMFSLNVLAKNKNTRLIAVEPIPPTFTVLKKNLELYEKTEVVNAGISNKKESAEFCYFPGMSTDSVQVKYRENHDLDLRLGLENFYKHKVENKKRRERLVNHLMSPKVMDEKRFFCRMITISNIIEERKIEHVDLLKIDVEKSEFEALEGIREEHWPIIDQVVMEVHRLGEEQIKKLKEIFSIHGFEIIVDFYQELDIPNYYNVYASRIGMKCK